MRYLFGFLCVCALALSIIGCGDDELPTDCNGLPDGTPCLNEGYPNLATTCRTIAASSSVCGAAELCPEGQCEDENACTSEEICLWDGRCSWEEKHCADFQFCTSDACDPSPGECTNAPINEGMSCVTDSNWTCCFWSFGFGQCCSSGTCSDGVCVPN